jgi:hypothetical protein
VRRIDGDIAPARSYHLTMPFWHCPHCGTPQPEAARCWVCRKSSTTCATCRSYRRAVVGQLGYCAFDRRRDPLTGGEVRACWEAPASTSSAVAPRPMTVVARPTTTRSWTEVGRSPGAITDPETANEPGSEPAGREGPIARSIIDAPPPGLWSDAEA